jgi:hypothetical protein
MRPRLQRRGEQHHRDQDHRERRASMRPRLQRRGEPIVRPSVAAGSFTASMRSRLQRRGERTAAAIRLVGGNASMRPRLQRRGEPGPIEVVRQSTLSASMRPRLQRRGEQEPVKSISRGLASLQCGHGFSAVENAPSGARPVQSGTLLQCGHGFSAVENALASLIARGLIVLQCGHGFSAVENPINGKPRPRMLLTLQCGHGFSAVENRLDVPGLRRDEGASMRPRLQRRGEPNPGDLEAEGRSGFNAATASAPWRTVQTAGRAGSGSGCFNAATASAPWRTVRFVNCAVERDYRILRERLANHTEFFAHTHEHSVPNSSHVHEFGNASGRFLAV